MPSVVDWPLVLGGALAIVPAFAILFVSYGPYDGFFKDNILFLFFIGGILVGFVLAFFEFLLLRPRDPVYLVPMVLVGVPLVEQMAKLVVLNRKKYRSEREATFYGGSFGLGVGVMAVLFHSQVDIRLTAYRDLGAIAADPGPLAYLGVVGVAVLLAQFATGLIVGDAVRRQVLRVPMVVAVGALVPLQLLLFEFTAGLGAGRGSEGVLYLPLMVAYSAALAWWAHSKLLPQALPPDAQRKRRRIKRAAQRSGEP